MTEWWTQTNGTLIAAIGGAGVGVAGGILGALTGFLAPRGKGRTPILAAFAFFFILGACSLGLGIAAYAMHQPHHVAFPLVNLGIVLAPLFGSLWFIVRRTYAQHDHRRLEAEALRRAM